MTDEEQARSALAEVARRRSEVPRLANRQGAPVWYGAVVVVAILAMCLHYDLRWLNPEWDGWFAQWGMVTICLVVALVVAVAGWRRAVVSVHRSAYGERTAVVAAVAVPFYLCMLVIGIPMRILRIPFDQTVSLLGTALLFGAGWLVWRRVRARRD